MYKVPATYPAIVVDSKVTTGFKSIEEVESLSPELTKIIKDAELKKEKAVQSAAKAAAEAKIKSQPKAIEVKASEKKPIILETE
jgi:hypothetical protein